MEVSESAIRKVWVPTAMKEALAEYCWRHRTKPSPLIVAIIDEYVADPGKFSGMPIPPAGTNNVSVYLALDYWDAAVEVATKHGTRLSAVIRAELGRRIADEGIPWDATSPRPRNERIPELE